MAFKEQIEYCFKIKGLFPAWFFRTKILEVGSQDVCGSIRSVFWGCEYTGLDIGPGKNVTHIGLGHEWDAPDEYYDTIVCCDVAEHDRYYKETIRNIIRMLRPGGLFLLTCATTGYPEHGTTRTSSFASPYTNDYYKNVTEEMLRSIKGFNDAWFYSKMEISERFSHLRFVGIKNPRYVLPDLRLRFKPSLAILVLLHFYSFVIMRVRDINNGINRLFKHKP